MLLLKKADRTEVGPREGAVGSQCLTGTRVSVWEDENVPEVGGDGRTAM